MANFNVAQEVGVKKYDYAFVVGDGENPHMLYAMKEWIRPIKTTERNGFTLLDEFEVLGNFPIKITHANHHVIYPFLADEETGEPALLEPGTYLRDEQQELSATNLVRRMVD